MHVGLVAASRTALAILLGRRPLCPWEAYDFSHRDPCTGGSTRFAEGL